MNKQAGNGNDERGTAERPNVLMIMTDQMRWDLLSCAGHPICKTPVLDVMAERGVRFANFYSAAPICTPARYSIFNGRHVDVHDGWWNGLPTRDGEVFLPSILQHYGYATAIAGKLHFDPVEDSFGFDDFRTFRAEGPTPERGYEAYMKGKYGEWKRDRIEEGTCPWPGIRTGEAWGCSPIRRKTTIQAGLHGRHLRLSTCWSKAASRGSFFPATMTPTRLSSSPSRTTQCMIESPSRCGRFRPKLGLYGGRRAVPRKWRT